MPITFPLYKAGFDLDLAKLEDEQLVMLVQDCDFAPARDEILLRCRILKDHLVNRFAARFQLQDADRQDLHQDAVLWIIEALTHYKTEEYLKRNGCRFRSFLYRVLSTRIIDYYRQFRLHRKQCGLAGSLLTWLDEDSKWRLTRESPSTTLNDREELEGLLHEKIAQLSQNNRELWNLLVIGTPLREAASILTISYDKAKRRRRNLLKTLRSFLSKQTQT